MKRIIVVLWMVLMITTVNSQSKKGKDTEFYPTIVDSLYSYEWDSANKLWKLSQIWQYNYLDDKPIRLTFLNGGDRSISRATDYYYDSCGNKILDWHTYPVGATWVNTSKREYVFNSLGQTTLMNYFLWTKNNWVISAKSIYEYNEGRLSRVIQQKLNALGQFVDNAYYINIYEGDVLVEYHTQRASDSIITQIDKYLYNSIGKVSELLSLVYKIEPDDSVTYVPATRRIYTYDKYHILKKILFDRWNGTAWDTYMKYVYFRKIDFAKKVALCHKNKTLSIAKNAVPAHLAHGDYLGKCKTESSHHHKESKNQSPQMITKSVSFSFYPNPAQNYINITSGSQLDIIHKYEVFDLSGRIVLSLDNINSPDVSVDISNLPNGVYLFRAFGSTIFEEKVIKY